MDTWFYVFYNIMDEELQLYAAQKLYYLSILELKLDFFCIKNIKFG